MRWVKIYDSILDWRWHHKPEYVSFMLHCLLKANPKPTKWETIELEKGQFVTSMKSMCESVGITERTYRTIVKNLTDCGFLTVKTTNKYSVVTICNYATYQHKKEEERQPNDNQPSDNSQAIDNQPSDNSQARDNQTTTDIEYKNKRITDFKEEENKETFLKNGGTAEKKVFEISELEKILSAENIYMTAQGYQEFKNLNESDDRYGYKGGVIRSAKMFLKNPKNAIYRKNAPPAPRPQQKPPDQAALKAASEIWEKVKKILAEEMMPQSFKTWILPIVPLKLESGTLKIQVPSQYFQEYLEGNYIQLLSKALNNNGIKQLIYSIKLKN